MKKYLFLAVIITGFSLFAQVDMYKVSWAPGGYSAEAGTVKLVATTGEVFVREANVVPIHLSEGFIGPDLIAFLGVENYAPLNGVKIFPNPVSEVLTIRFPEQSRYEVYLYDLTGKMIFSAEVSDFMYRLNMKDYLNGLYLLVVIDREKETYFSTKIKKI